MKIERLLHPNCSEWDDYIKPSENKIDKLKLFAAGFYYDLKMAQDKSNKKRSYMKKIKLKGGGEKT